MNVIIYPLITSFISAAIVTLIGLPLIIKGCRYFEYFDFPDARKVHRKPVPRLGGLIFLPAAVVGLCVASWTSVLTGGEEFVFGVSTVAMTIGGLIIYLIGFIDDRFGMKASHKFVIQTIAALILPLCNLVITDLNGLFGLHQIPFLVGYVLTVMAILTIVNAINLIDGIDGLSSGLCIFILVAYTALLLLHGNPAIASLDAAIVGSLVVFWCFNVFGRVGGLKIFMGDAGSLFLGYVCAYMSIKSLMRPIAPVDCGEEQMLISITLLLIPVLDVIRVALQRRLTGHGIFEPDKTHIHHILMNAGLSMHATLACILSLFLLICGINYSLWQCHFPMPLIVLMDAAIYILVWGVLNLMNKSND
ncbi:MAG: undecaprenyl/decaprenyl-phosphate alpha-N-acetylglucosaminyl 1-phosphate transferase [Bacteroidaceae bacterium]|nr:undecaprenyl/decaprenyl-phosphate alpha-N-acetylglucosaminyl 1-phosphate transferase [Bacteroidaceae bacterium]